MRQSMIQVLKVNGLDYLWFIIKLCAQKLKFYLLYEKYWDQSCSESAQSLALSLYQKI